MNLRLENGELALPADFKFDISSNHPFFSDEGTASVPVTIPPSELNLALLGHPENHHSASRYSRLLPATLSHGVFFKRCKVIIDAASPKTGATASLALQESELYAEFKDRKLTDIFTSTEIRCQTPATVFENWAKSRTGDYVSFPVAADAKDVDTPDATGSKKKVTTILNDHSSGNLDMGSRTIKVKEDEEYTAAAGYANVPFMKLHAILRRMFEEEGRYSVSENVFATDPVLSQVVVLHNTADVMCASWRQLGSQAAGYIVRIQDSQIVPSITVADMLEWIRLKFGAFVTVKGNHIFIRLIRDAMEASPDMDLSPYMEEDFTVGRPSPKMLRLSCRHDIEGSAPAAETLEDLRARYSSLVPATSVDTIQGAGLFYVRPLGKYYYRQSADTSMGTALAGTDGFDYYRAKDMDTEDMAADDSFVPMVLHNGAYMPFIGDTIRRNIDTSDKATDAEQALMVCYVRTSGGWNFGTLYHYTPSGAEDSAHNNTPDLTPEKLGPHFFAPYQGILLNAAPTVTCRLSIPLHVLSSMDPWTPKLLNRSKALITSLKYSVSDSGISSCEATFQLLSAFADSEEVTDPSFGSSLGWRRKTTQQYFDSGTVGKYKNYVKVTPDGVADYTSADAPTWTPVYPGVKAKTRRRYVRVTVHSGYYKWFLDNGWSEYTFTHYYDEYFESYNQG